MPKQANITLRNNKFFVSGDVDFSNVMSVYNKSLPQLEKCSEFNFDFSQLQSSDSSGLALVIEWIKLAKNKKKKIIFQHLSQDLLSIAKAAGIDVLLP